MQQQSDIIAVALAEILPFALSVTVMVSVKG